MSQTKSAKTPNASQPSDDDADHDAREAQDDPHRLAKVFLRDSAARAKFRWQLAFWRDQWWVWEGRRYQVQTDAEMNADVTAAIKREFDRWARRARKGSTDDSKDEHRTNVVGKVTRGRVSNVLQALKSLVLIRSDIAQPSWLEGQRNRKSCIALENGLLDLDALLSNRQDVLTAHTSKWFSPVCLPYRWDPEASCPGFQNFLREIFEGDTERINLLQEWFGLCLVADMSFQKFLILLGEGANGKTAVLTVLTKLLGEANVSHVPLELFGQRFQLAPTLGKLANIVSEIGDCNRVDEAILKSFVAGEPVHIDRKRLSPTQASATARLILATNNLPAFADRSSGLWRRLTIVPFHVVVPPNRQDRELTDKLLEELPGIFNWAIEGLRRLQARKNFTEPPVCREALNEHRLGSNPARAFLTDEMEFCEGAGTPSGDVYQHYKFWCGEHGSKPLDDRYFGKEVARVYPRVTRQRATGGRGAPRPWIYVGLRFVDRVATPFPAPVPRRLAAPVARGRR